jgi:hypothetical protein
MISRAYEYFDTGQIEKFLGPSRRDLSNTVRRRGMVKRCCATSLPTIESGPDPSRARSA